MLTLTFWKPPDFYYYAVCAKWLFFPPFWGLVPPAIIAIFRLRLECVHFWYLKNPGLITILNFWRPRQHFPLHPSRNKVSWIYTLWILAPLLLLCIIFNRSLHQKIYHKRTTGTFLSKRGTLIIFQKRSWKKSVEKQ